MIEHSPLPQQIPHARLVLRTGGTCDLDPSRLLEVFGEQRRRFAAVLQGFAPDDWAAPTRCVGWSAHEVVRHLCDGNAIGAAAGPDDRTLDLAAGFDPRTTPCAWLTASAGESPGATLSRFVATTEELLALLRARLAQQCRFDVRLPYGPMDWTVFVLHGFWDSWLHERDVLLARGAEHPTDADATSYAAAYGLFIAAAVASMFGDPVQEKLTLGGEGGGVFDLEACGGAVTLSVTRMATAGPPVAQVTDALAGRDQTAAVLGDLPASSRAGLSRLADYMNTPVEQRPA
jgi:uncharacterized protein (TIGR03083 family)